MDPNETYRQMFECVKRGDYESANEHALNLKSWLKRGGFYPDYCIKEEVDVNIANVLRGHTYKHRV